MIYFVASLLFLPVVISSVTPFEGMSVVCRPETVYIDIEEHGCRANGVAIDYCKGNCRSATKYVHEYPYYKSICECCKHKSMKKKLIHMDCEENKKKIIARDSVTECECSICETKK